MAWPATAVVTGDPVTTIQLNGLPVLIANTTLSADAASVNITGIPQHYAHLKMEMYARGDVAAAAVETLIWFNGDTGATYDRQSLNGNAATVVATENFGTSLQVTGATANTAGANLFGGIIFEIPHYANAANNKELTSRGALKWGTTTGTLYVARNAGFWRSNAAINAVTVLPVSGNWRAGSRFALYGLA